MRITFEDFDGSLNSADKHCQLIPRPVYLHYKRFTIVSTRTWNVALLIPMVKSSVEIMMKDGATPNKLITIDVMAGATIIKYLGAVLSEIILIRGFNNHGRRMIKSYIEAMASVIPNFSISKGLSGAKKEEYISSNICDAETRITLPD